MHRSGPRLRVSHTHLPPLSHLYRAPSAITLHHYLIPHKSRIRQYSKLHPIKNTRRYRHPHTSHDSNRSRLMKYRWRCRQSSLHFPNRRMVGGLLPLGLRWYSWGLGVAHRHRNLVIRVGSDLWIWTDARIVEKVTGTSSCRYLWLER